ncbi:MAG: thiamine biosynthesis protein ApbE [Rhodocyclales bacterium RIFCSPLOWO2_02_FULL_63_24]|nr:MAG: thiamine biosynthesis protein ApbE [Rhodocyclales bacterium GWA2_65_19]OHC73047.1 MAG: thiamine biosynthesis protein ApbE [Rhodocyclales bacterium RIFCSPLOWO2_02_FULL_63_24]
MLLAAAWLLAACGPSAPWRQESYVFGTRVELLIVGVPEAQARAAGNRVLQEFDRLHRTYHAWQPSELSALNEAIAAGRSHQVSAEFAAFIREAQTIAAAGDHFFDPGIGRLIALWGFHTDEIQPRLPDPAAVKALLARQPSIADLRLDGNRISSRNQSVALDFGGYLKGVALDRAVALLKQDGIAHALINIGGNVMALGSRDGKPNGAAWRIGIQHPRPQGVGGAPLATLELRDGEAIGTSGDYHRYFELDGRRYCHLLDPRSGFPATATQAVTVLIAPGPGAGTRSDALSKPIFIAGPDWREMARRLGVVAVLRVGADGTASATPAMAARIKIEVPDLKLEVVQ